MSRHHVESFTADGREGWGWQCFTCGAENDGYGTLRAAETGGLEHAAQMSPVVPRTVTINGETVQVRRLVAGVEKARRDKATISRGDVWAYYLDMLGRRAYRSRYTHATTGHRAPVTATRSVVEVTLHRRVSRFVSAYPSGTVLVTWDSRELDTAAAAANTYRAAR